MRCLPATCSSICIPRCFASCPHMPITTSLEFSRRFEQRACRARSRASFATWRSRPPTCATLRRRSLRPLSGTSRTSSRRRLARPRSGSNRAGILLPRSSVRQKMPSTSFSRALSWPKPAVVGPDGFQQRQPGAPAEVLVTLACPGAWGTWAHTQHKPAWIVAPGQRWTHACVQRAAHTQPQRHGRHLIVPAVRASHEPNS